MSDAIVDVSLIYSDDSENSKEFVYGECIGELVRCGECKYYDEKDHNCLDEMAYARCWMPTDFCSFGERREE